MLGDRENRPKRDPKEMKLSNRKIVTDDDLKGKPHTTSAPHTTSHSSGPIQSSPQSYSTGGSGRRKAAGGSVLGIIILIVWFLLTKGQGGAPPIDINELAGGSGGSGYSEQYANLEHEDLSGKAVTPAEKKPYTVLVYMNGTDLESKYGCATSDLQEMASSGFDAENVNLLVLTGGTANWKNNIISSTTSIYQINGTTFSKLSDLGNVSIADENVLKAYVDFGIENFPAERYGFVFWNHGGGTIHGYGSDQNYNGAHLSIDQIADAFDHSRMAQNKFEFIGFDCCLMGTLETACLLQPFARYMVASEEVEPGYGWDYSWLGTLSANPQASGDVIGKDIVDKYVEFYKKTGDQATLAVLDLSKVQSLSQNFEAFTANANEAIQQGGFDSISQARKGTKSFGYTGQDRNSFDLVDIKHMAQKLQRHFPEESDAVINSVESSVVYYRNSDNIENAFGISTYVPYAAKEMAAYSVEKYEELDLMPHFANFLSGFTQKLTGQRVPRPAVSKAKPELVKDTNAVAIKLSPSELKQINAITFTIWKQLEENSDYFVKLGLDTAVDISEDGTIQTQFDGYWPTLGGQLACFYEVEKGNNYEKYSTPAKLNGEDVNIIVMADDQNPNGKVLGAIPPSPEGGIMAPKMMQPINSGDRLALKYFCQLFLEDEADYGKYENAEQWVDGEEFIVGDSLDIEIVPVDDELYLYGFWIEDTQGNHYYTDFIEIRY